MWFKLSSRLPPPPHPPHYVLDCEITSVFLTELKKKKKVVFQRGYLIFFLSDDHTLQLIETS